MTITTVNDADSAPAWTVHHRVLYAIIAGGGGVTAREIEAFYAALKDVAYQGTLETPVESQRWRRTLRDELEEAGLIESVEMSKGAVFLPTDPDREL